MEPVPNPLLLRNAGSAGNRTRDLWVCSQELWPLDHRGGPNMSWVIWNRILNISFTTSRILSATHLKWSRDSSVSTTTGYWLDGIGSSPCRSKLFRFSKKSNLVDGPSQPPIRWVLVVLFPGVKLPGSQVEGWSSGSHSFENSVWKRLRTCRKTDRLLLDLVA
jgi:hypothetical protein